MTISMRHKLVALFGGFRLSEISQMTVADIKPHNGFQCFHINREGEKTTKNKSSIRPIPIHPMLIKLGFDQYINQRKESGQVSLFESTYDYGGMFNENILNSAEIKKPELTFHSLRHTFAHHLRSRIRDEETRKRLMGHAPDTMTAGYGGGLSSAEMQEFVDNFEIPIDWKKLLRKPKLPV